MITVAKGYDEKINILKFDIPEWNCGYTGEYKKLYDEMNTKLSKFFCEDGKRINVFGYTALEVDYPTRDFLLMYIYTLHRFSVKNPSVEITIYCDGDVSHALYSSTYEALTNNCDLYNKGVINLFNDKTVTIREPVNLKEKLMISSKRGAQTLNKVIDRAGKKQILLLNKQLSSKIARYCPVGGEVIDAHGLLILYGSDSHILKTGKDYVDIIFTPTYYF